jgi:hypothetical protein
MPRKYKEVFSIQTEYKGVKFRSKAEARWAVFFDTLGIKWQYEPEGYTDGTKKYLPDFYLPELGWFLEVKGTGATFDTEKVGLAVRATGKPLIVWRGEPTISWGHDCDTCPRGFEAPIAYVPMASGIAEDHPFWWCECPKCGRFGLTFDAESNRLPCGCNADDRNAGHSAALHRAVTEANTYRFWNP